MGDPTRIAQVFDTTHRTNQVDKFVEIQTLYVYPDGTPAKMYIPHNDPLMVADLGETIRWVRHYVDGMEREGMRDALVDRVCRSRGVMFQSGMFFTRVSSVDELPEGVEKLARATVFLGEMWVNGESESAGSWVG